MGNQQPKLLAGLPVVLIIGGGYGGVAAAKALDASGKVNVILIERKEYRLHNIASFRAAVEQGYEKNILIPYTHLLKHGAVIHAQVTSIEASGIRVFGYEHVIKFDYCVIATGSTYPFPAKVDESSYQAACEKYHTVQSHIKNANNIALIGGGPVGIELAGEIASAYPTKKITLIHSHAQLLNDMYRSELRDEIKAQLELLHVNVVTNQRVNMSLLEQKSSESYIVGSQTLSSDAGFSIEADMIFLTTGTKLNTMTWKNTLPLAQDGRIKVNSFLQVDGHPHIYAIGDAASSSTKMAYYADLHGKHVASNILADIAMKPQKPYGGDGYPSIFVAIGPNGGASQFPNKNGTIIKSTLTRLIKSKNLFVDHEWSKMNLKPSSTPSPPTSTSTSELPDTRIRNVSAALGLPETDIQHATEILTKGFPVDRMEQEAKS